MILTTEQRRTLLKLCLAANGESMVSFAERSGISYNSLQQVIRGLKSEPVETAVDGYIKANLHRIDHAVSSARKQMTEAA